MVFIAEIGIILVVKMSIYFDDNTGIDSNNKVYTGSNPKDLVVCLRVLLATIISLTSF